MNQLFTMDLTHGTLTELRFSEPTSVINLKTHHALKRLAACGRIYKATPVTLEISLDDSGNYPAHDLQLTPAVDVTVLGSTWPKVEKLSFADCQLTLLSAQSGEPKADQPPQEPSLDDWMFDPSPVQAPIEMSPAKETRIQPEQALQDEWMKTNEQCNELKAKIAASKRALARSEEEWLKLSSELHIRCQQVQEKVRTLDYDARFDIDAIGKLRETEFLQVKELDELETEYHALKAKIDCLGVRLHKLCMQAENEANLRSKELNEKNFPQ